MLKLLEWWNPAIKFLKLPLESIVFASHIKKDWIIKMTKHVLNKPQLLCVHLLKHLWKSYLL